MTILRSRDYLPPGCWFHAARSRLDERSDPTLHGHDFAEVYWIESGEAEMTCRPTMAEQPRTRPVGRGYLALVLPEDCHGFRAPGTSSFVITNVAFGSDTLDHFRHRNPELFPDNPDQRSWQLGNPGLHWLETCFLQLARSASLGRIAIDRFLTEVLAEATQASRQTAARPLPDWLETTLERFWGLEEAFSDPVSRLAVIAGRSREHISRVIKETTGMSALRYVRSIMLQEAALELSLSDLPVIDIALKTGFANLGNFYNSFKKAFGCTPLEYRRKARGVMGRHRDAG